ncbi:MAG TPA: hypothetical protein VF377_03740 [Acidimicrobiia bacterium]
MIPPVATELYALPIGEFTAGRDRLVRQLGEEGKKEESAQVKRLRKPTTDAWALNQVARRNPELIDQLVQVHEELRRAGDPVALRRSSEKRIRLLEEITAAAASALVDAGHSAEGSVRDRIGRTLLAAAGDESTEQQLRRGILTKTADVSAGWPEAFGVSPPGPAEKEPDPTVAEELQLLQERAEEAAQLADELKAQARKAREELEEVRRRLEDAETAAKEADRAAREAKRAWEEARRRSR